MDYHHSRRKYWQVTEKTFTSKRVTYIHSCKQSWNRIPNVHSRLWAELVRKILLDLISRFFVIHSGGKCAMKALDIFPQCPLQCKNAQNSSVDSRTPRIVHGSHPSACTVCLIIDLVEFVSTATVWGGDTCSTAPLIRGGRYVPVGDAEATPRWCLAIARRLLRHSRDPKQPAPLQIQRPRWAVRSSQWARSFLLTKALHWENLYWLCRRKGYKGLWVLHFSCSPTSTD